MALLVVGPVTRFIWPADPVDSIPDRLRVATSAEFAPGVSRLVRFGSQPVLVFRTAGGELHALSGVCTHLRCTLEYRADLAQIACPCHDGRFTQEGTPISGPPPGSLAPFHVEDKGGEVWLLKS